MSKFGKFAAACAAVLGAFGAMAEDNPFAGYDHKAKITFGGYAGESTLTNFPALVRLTEGVGGFSYADCAQANGGDVRFTRGDGVELASECVKWDTTGESQFWVRVPELTSDTVIYMCWGNADAAKRDQRLRVWDRDYTAVWSMDDAGKGIADKSGRGNYGNSSSASTGAAGVAGVARQFASANSEWAQAGHGYNDSFCGPQVAYECWYNLASYPTSQRAILAYSTMNGDFDSRAQKRILQLSTKGVPCFAAATSFNGTGTQPELGTWHHAMVALDVTGKTCDVYMDGQRVGGGAFTKAENTVNQYILMQFAKANYSGASGTYFDGSLDEVRVSRVVRSADYAAAVFLNAASNDLFMAIASIDALPEIDPPAPRKFTFTISAEAGGTVTPSVTVRSRRAAFSKSLRRHLRPRRRSTHGAGIVRRRKSSRRRSGFQRIVTVC